MGAGMEMAPRSVGRAARDWDEQEHDVAAAAGALGTAETTGFPDRVVGAADAFVRSWEQLTAALAATAHAEAEGLRATMADWLATDRATADHVVALAPHLRETR